MPLQLESENLLLPGRPAEGTGTDPHAQGRHLSHAGLRT